MWSPAHYLWTPAGYVHVEGYWDRPLAQRGVVFAPRRFKGDAIAAAKPAAVVVDLNAALHHWFVLPAQRHYCFGDYYQTSYSRYGVQPQFDFHVRRGFDPLFAYYTCRFRELGVDFPEKAGERHRYYLRRTDERPARTWLADQPNDLARGWREVLATGDLGKPVWEPEATRAAVQQGTRDRRELESRRRRTEADSQISAEPRLRLPAVITTAWRAE